jgi:hypothetical protein
MHFSRSTRGADDPFAVTRFAPATGTILASCEQLPRAASAASLGPLLCRGRLDKQLALFRRLKAGEKPGFPHLRASDAGAVFSLKYRVIWCPNYRDQY